MARALTKSRVMLIVIAPITLPAIFGALEFPLGHAARLLPNPTAATIVHFAGIGLGLAGSIAIHVRMWRALKPAA